MNSYVRARAWMTLAAAFAVMAARSHAGNVLVVDAAGGGGFTTIQSAVDAAVDGDTILVESGSYAAFNILDKSVAVVADTNAVVDVAGPVRVGALGANRDALLVGLRMLAGPSRPYALRAESNLGSVRVENCRFESLGYLANAAWVVASDDVALTRCSFVTAEPTIYPGDALRVESSDVAIYDSEVRGGDSADSCNAQPGCEDPDGGSAAVVRGSFFFAAGSSFYGGNGGIGSAGGALDCICGSDGGDGGDGIDYGSSVSSLLDNLYRAGRGAPTCGCGFHMDGQAGLEIRGNPTKFDGRARHLAIKNPRRELTSFRLEVRGRARETVHLYVSESTGFSLIQAYRGVLIPQNPAPPIYLGRIPENGILQYPYGFSDLGPGVQSKTVYFQAVHTNEFGVQTLGNPVSLVVLDQAF